MTKQKIYNPKKSVIPILKIRYYFDPRITISCGVVHTENGFFCLGLALEKSKAPVVISRTFIKEHGQKFLSPVIAHAEMEHSPVLFLSEEHNGIDGDSFMDANEARVIPPGTSPDKIVNEWQVKENKIYSATCTNQALALEHSKLSDAGILPASLAMPLWCLVNLYSRYNLADYLLWHIKDRKSTLVSVRKKELISLCTFWAGHKDITENPAEVKQDLNLLCKSVSGQMSQKVILVTEYDLTALPDIFYSGQYPLVSAPIINGIKQYEHRVYALAMHSDVHIDFLSYEQRESLKKIALLRKRIAGLSAWTMGIFLAGLMLCCLVYIGAIAGEKIIAKRLFPLRSAQTELSYEQQRADSLTAIYQKQAAFYGSKSIVTWLLSAFQNVFPENTWLSKLDITNTGQGKYRLEIEAFAYSTSDIPSVLKNIGAYDGITNVRMVYSEKTTVEGTVKKAILFKCECGWEQKKIHLE